jgi:hypothetical protein
MLVLLLLVGAVSLSRAQLIYPNLPDAFSGTFYGAGFYKSLLPTIQADVIRGFAFGMV